MTIGVDTGGTFTDLVHVRDDGKVETAKRPSTPSDFWDEQRIVEGSAGADGA